MQRQMPTASLANMTSGTTFAAKARAAELNAVRAQQAAKAKSPDLEMPSGTTSDSGAVKFTKPRNRSRVEWKPLNLSELPDPEVLEPSVSTRQAPDYSSNAGAAAVSRYVKIQ